MKGEENLVLLIGDRPIGDHVIGDRREGPVDRMSPAELLRRAAEEVRSFATPADALDALSSRTEPLPLDSRVLFVVDERGCSQVGWTWLSLFASLGLGPVILLVDEVDDEISLRAGRCGVSRCLDDRHLARHPGLLVRAARRALAGRRRLAIAALEG